MKTLSTQGVFKTFLFSGGN